MYVWYGALAVYVCVCVWVGVYELWESFRPTVCARSSVSHQSATVETLDMPMFILVPAGVLCASSHRLFFVKGLITRPVLFQVLLRWPPSCYQGRASSY